MLTRSRCAYLVETQKTRTIRNPEARHDQDIHHRAISKRSADALSPGGSDALYRDTALPGFGIRVYASGRKTHVVQCRGPNGSRHATIGRHGDVTLDQARKKAAIAIDRIKQGEDSVPPPPTPEPTVADLAVRFMEAHVRVNCKPSSALHYRRVLDNHILPALGLTAVRGVEPTHVVQLHHSLHDRPVAANKPLCLPYDAGNTSDIEGGGTWP